MKGFYSYLRAMLALLFLASGVGTAWGYEVTFKTASSDGSTANTTVSNYVDSGAGYISSMTNTTKAYYNGKSGMKLGSKSAVGSAEFTLSDTGTTIGQIKATSVSVVSVAIDSGKSYKCTVTYTDNSTTSATVVFGADNVMNLDATKTIQKIKFESLTASKGRGYITFFTVTPALGQGGNVSVTGVTVSPTTATLNVGETVELTATVQPNDATNKAVSWTSSDPEVATVSDAGVVTAVAAGGPVTITATTADGGKTGTCAVTVNAVGGGDATSYTITFQKGSGDGSTLSTGTDLSDVVSSGADKITSIATATLTYYGGGNGLKLGKSGSGGTVKFNLSDDGKKNATTIVVRARLYNASKSATIQVNGETAQSLTSDSFDNYTFHINSNIEYIELVSSNYCWIESITVNYSTAAAKYHVTYNANGAEGDAPVDATEYDKDATVTVAGAGNLTKAEHTFAGWNTSANGTGTAYAAGSTFTITADVNLFAQWASIYPYVHFVANTDKGSSTSQGADSMNKGCISISSTNAAFAQTEYRIYSNSTTTFSSTTAWIRKIEFIGNDNSNPLSYLNVKDGNGTYDINTHVWEGRSQSVQFGANGQARATEIKVYYEEPTPSAPVFTTQPTGATYTQGDAATPLTVAATGYPAPAYQWYVNTTASTDGATAIAGATGASYTPATDTPGIKYYFCKATNSEAPEGVASAIAAVTVNVAQYTLTYDANGGEGTAPDAVTDDCDTVVTLPDGTGLGKTGYTFGGWNTAADGSGMTYYPGETFTITANTTLYALWEDINSYKVVFTKGGDDLDGSSFSTNKNLSDVIKRGTEFCSAFSTVENCAYACKYGLKLGMAGDNPGTLDIALSDAGKVHASTITVRARLYTTQAQAAEATIQVNGPTALTITSTDFADYTFDIDAAIDHIELASSKYCYIESVTVRYKYAVSWLVNNHQVAATFAAYGSKPTLPAAPTSADFDGVKVFMGWSNAEVSDGNAPQLLFTDADGSPAITGPATFHAVFATRTESGSGNSTTKTITTSTAGFPSSYGSANTFTEYTLEGVKFMIQQGYVNGTYLQFRAGGNTNGTGTIYNSEKLDGLQSVVITYDSNDKNNNFTLYAGSSANPTSGTPISPTNNDLVYTFDLSGGNYSYFVLTNGSDAGYLTSIAVTYGGGTTITYSDYATSYDETAPTLTGIAVDATNAKTEYTEGEALDLDGIVINGTFSDDSTDVVPASQCTFTPAAGTVLTTDVTSVAVTYNADTSFTASFNITVNPRPTCAITWSVNGETTTGTQIQGDDIVQPADPASIDGLVFRGWAKDAINGTNATGEGIRWIDDEVPYASSATYYAVFAEVREGSTNIEMVSPETTSGDITVSISNGAYNDGEYRVYKGQTMTIASSGGNITSIVFTFDGKYTGDWSTAYTPNAATWTSPSATTEQARINKILITYGAATYANFVTSIVTVSSIALKQAPATTAYYVGQELDLTGGLLTVNYSNSESEDIELTAEGVSVSGYDNTQAGTCAIAVTYRGKTIENAFSVTVANKPTYAIAWKVNGQDYDGLAAEYTTQTWGDNLNMPAAPTDPSGDNFGGRVFQGWADASTVNADGTGIAYASSDDTVSGPATYYAVFADESGVTSDVVDITTAGLTSGSSYSNSADVLTFGSTTYNVEKMMVNDGVLQCQASTGKIYNTTPIAGLHTIVIDYGEKNTNQNFTLTVGTSQNPTGTDGVGEVTEGKRTTFTIPDGMTFFELRNGKNAGYVDAFTIKYGTMTRTNYCTTFATRHDVATFTFGEDVEATAKVDQRDYAHPSLTAKFDAATFIQASAITWSSSAPAVAAVDETTGSVTLLAVGTATITARFAGNDAYRPAEAHYTLTVGQNTASEFGWANATWSEDNTRWEVSYYLDEVPAAEELPVLVAKDANGNAFDVEKINFSVNNIQGNVLVTIDEDGRLVVNDENKAGQRTVNASLNHPGYEAATAKLHIELKYKAAPTFRFDGNTAIEVDKGAALPTLPALDNPGNMAVAYSVSSTPDGMATIDAATGELTLTNGTNTSGVVTVTATGTKVGYADQTATYTISVNFAGTGAGTLEDPYDVTRALDMIECLYFDNDHKSNAVYVKGIVTSIDNDYNKNNFHISVDGEASDEFYAFDCNEYESGLSWDDVAEGKHVVIYGTIYKFRGTTPEMNTTKLVSSRAKTAPNLRFEAPTYIVREGIDEVPVAVSNSGAAITYASGNTAVATGGDAITLVAYGTASITASQAENETYTAAEASCTLKYVPASITVRTNGLGWATFAPSYDVMMPEGQNGVDVYYISETEDGKSVVKTSDAIDDIVPDYAMAAGTGVLVKTSTPNTDVEFACSTITDKDQVMTSDILDNLLVGVIEADCDMEKNGVRGKNMDGVENAYIFTMQTVDGKDKVGFYVCGGGMLAAGKCYLHLTPAQAASAPRFIVLFDDGTATPIADIMADADEPMHDLTGRRVGTGYKGIVIVNGKKVMRK